MRGTLAREGKDGEIRNLRRVELTQDIFRKPLQKVHSFLSFATRRSIACHRHWIGFHVFDDGRLFPASCLSPKYVNQVRMKRIDLFPSGFGAGAAASELCYVCLVPDERRGSERGSDKPSPKVWLANIRCAKMTRKFRRTFEPSKLIAPLYQPASNVGRGLLVMNFADEKRLRGLENLFTAPQDGCFGAFDIDLDQAGQGVLARNSV
jgi:hypothetical protein